MCAIEGKKLKIFFLECQDKKSESYNKFEAKLERDVVTAIKYLINKAKRFALCVNLERIISLLIAKFTWIYKGSYPSFVAVNE